MQLLPMLRKIIADVKQEPEPPVQKDRLEGVLERLRASRDTTTNKFVLPASASSLQFRRQVCVLSCSGKLRASERSDEFCRS